MNPAFSVVIFTTIAGAAQGMVVALALARLVGVAMAPSFLRAGLAIAGVMLLIGLAASFAHLGRPERAWRAVLMWRTSWLSREVIVLPAFIGVVALWWLALYVGIDTVWLPLAAIVVAALLWYCTAMIYACLRFIEEWAQPLTLVNFTLIGLSSGLILTSALSVVLAQPELLPATGTAALLVTVVAWVTRTMALRRNAVIKHKSTLQSATGIRAPNLVQKSMGMSAGSFNTREFFHHAGLLAMKNVKLALIVLGFALPTALLLWGVTAGFGLAFVLALAVQVPGLVADRWFFFAQAKHPQNLYYQVVS
ncbi:dimethyl sulfoxide reductase anchor subunit family protein [Variovorax guangxiensis]|uniref:DMSO reductase n=1 Tax=Variovorax guangxiensis TaxID=1775474 RepID=A0A502E0X8_9BURK|nr:DmsC/YnfH family molybdoenzyme membrane anchor subunit [Variovorax guangxiensis]TPG26446.1 DMSO reductase [Variovorax ginsengisoli]TPG30171.1 DMSO reductase [Variovorax guangxiensis]